MNRDSTLTPTRDRRSQRLGLAAPVEPSRLRARWREGLLVLSLAVLLAAFISRAPMAQSQHYHVFADQRSILGAPNMLNVLSNAPFLIVGGLGLALCAGARRPEAAASWAMVFAATALVAFGSAWYHWAPSDATLVWDRLPMTIGFTALFVALLCDHLGERVQRYLLAPALAVGIASVVWWQWAGDLRLYYWVQTAPLACIPLVLALFPGRYTHRRDLIAALALYALAKLAELADAEVFEITRHAISGHTLKHLLAAGSLVAILVMLRRRSELTRSRSSSD